MAGQARAADDWSPDWATHPGEHLAEGIEARGWSQAEFARLAGLTTKHVSTIVRGKAPVTAETAVRLERVLGMKAYIWTGLQARWNLHLARLALDEQPEKVKASLKKFPIRDLKARGVLPDTSDKARVYDALLHFLNIGSMDSFDARMTSLAVHHRQSKAHPASPYNVATWLLLGERTAREMTLEPFRKARFEKAIREIRSLTTQPPEVFEPRMRQLCADSGVALVLEKPLPKTRLFGSARWLDGDMPVIQMSLRMKTNDHFWWTFFHEAAHILLHRGQTFVDEGHGIGDGLEAEADAWAEDILAGRDHFAAFKATRPRSARQVRGFADSIGIHPGIVVGMLQHAGIVPYQNLNGLKERFEWADEIEGKG